METTYHILIGASAKAFSDIPWLYTTSRSAGLKKESSNESIEPPFEPTEASRVLSCFYSVQNFVDASPHVAALGMSSL